MKLETQNKIDKFKGLKIGTAFFLIACVGFALVALFDLGIGRFMVLLGILGGFVGFAIHVNELISGKHKKNST